MFRLIEIYIRQGLPCLFHLITGFYCPGCGGTRAVKFLIRGQILKSIQYHPLVFYAAAVILAEFATYGLSRLLHKPEIHLKRYNQLIYLGIAVILINWILKNVLLLCGIDLLTETLW